MSLLIENCRISGRTEGSVYSEAGVISRILQGGAQEVPKETTRIDARGRALFVGFADTHCHPFELGWLERNVDLRGTSTIAELQSRLSAAVRKVRVGEWVVGMGWDHEAFPDKRLLTRADIDGVSRGNPVALRRICGHITLLNSRAIEALGLEGRGGSERDTDESGVLTGIVRERAQEEALHRIPGRSVQRCMDDLLSVESEAAKFGLTTLHCILSTDAYGEELEAIAAVAEGRGPSLRYRVYFPVEAMELVARKQLRGKLRGDRVRISGVKIYADGSLGARTAALREPYSDDVSNSGLLRYGDEELEGLVGRADSEGYQVIIHAIGDRAVEQAIRVLSPVVGRGNPLRHRVEHASLLPVDLRAKLRRLKVKVTVQPCFVISDAWAVQRLGEERIRDLYPFRSMLEEGIMASGSSDAPVETLNPIIGMWAALDRGGRSPEERLTLQRALDLYTRNAAANGFDEKGGVLREGGRADFTVLNSDLEGMHPAKLRNMAVAATVVGGKVVYSLEGGT